MRDIVAKEKDAALVGTEQAIHQFEQHAFTYPGGTEQNPRLARRNRKADIVQHRRAIKGDRNVLKGHDRRGGAGHFLVGLSGGEGFIHKGKRVSKTCVSRKSTKMIRTEAQTTA